MGDVDMLFKSESLLEVLLGSDSEGCKVSCMAWCRMSNLVAAALDDDACTGYRSVRIIDPEWPDEHTELQVPVTCKGEDGWAAIQHMSWTPRACARALMVADDMGAITVWQLAPGLVRVINQWVGERVGVADCWLTTAKWLEPPTLLKWPADRIANLSAPKDPERNLEARHRPPKSAMQGSPLLWLRPGLMCCAAVGADSGKLHIWWKEYQAEGWSALPPYQLQLGSLLAADVVATFEGAIRIAVVQVEYPHVVAVLEVTGHLGDSGGAAMRAPISPEAKLQVKRLCTVSPAMKKGMGAHVQVAFSPAHGGTSVLSITGGGSTPQVVVQRWAPPNRAGTGKAHYTWESCAVASVKVPGVEAPSTKKKKGRVVVEDEDEDPAGGPTLMLSWEGTIAVKMPGGKTVKVLEAGTLNSVDDIEVDKLGVLGALTDVATMAFSPNGCCLAVAAGRAPPPKPTTPSTPGGGEGPAAVLAPDGQARLRVLRVREGMSMPPGGDEDKCRHWCVRASDRLGWAMYSGRHFWDAAAALRGEVGVCAQGRWFREAAQEIDAAFHTLPKMRRPAYSAVLDRFKICLLKGEAAGPATAVSLDCQARCMLTAIEAMIKTALARPGDLLNALPELAGGPQTMRIEAEVVHAMRAWCEWVVGYTVFFLRCLRYWVHACKVHGPTSDAARSVPCARLLPDQYFHRKFISVLIFAGLCDIRFPPAVKAGPPSPVATTASPMLHMLRQVCGKAQQVRQNSMGRDEFLSDLAAAEAAASQFAPGPVALHYPQAVGAVGPEVIAAILDDDKIGPLATSLDELLLFGRSLGLQTADETPAFLTRPAPAEGGGGNDAPAAFELPQAGGAGAHPATEGGAGAAAGRKQGAGAAEGAPPGGGIVGAAAQRKVIARLVEAKRKRWRDEHDVAFGRKARPPPPPDTSEVLLRDAVSGHVLPPEGAAGPGTRPLMCTQCHRRTISLPLMAAETCPEKKMMMYAWAHGCLACGGMWKTM